MKKIIALLIAVFISTGFQTKGFADELVDSFINKAGITPDSILYPIDVAIDNLKITLAIGVGNKINAAMNVAEERLGEGQVLLEKGQEEKVRELINEYHEKMDGVTKEVEDKIEESEDEDDRKEDKRLDKIKRIHKKVAIRQEKALRILNRIKEKENVPEEVKAKIEAVIQMQTMKKEVVRRFVEERHQYNEAKKAYNEAVVALKKVKKSGDDKAITIAEENLKKLEELKNQAKGELKEAFKAKSEAEKKANETKKETIKRINEEMKNKHSNQDDKKVDDTKGNRNRERKGSNR